MNEKFYIIINPVSANHTTGKEWPRYEILLREAGLSFEAALTQYPEHATTLAREALKSGFTTILSVGGDGTLNEVANGFFESGSPINENARLAVFSRGTGCDFIRSIGLKKEIEPVIEMLKRNTPMYCDIGKVRYQKYEKGLEDRYFLNISDLGIGGETTYRVNKSSKALKGFLSFAMGALSAIAAYHNRIFEIVIDDRIQIKARLNSVIVANGRYFGGGMEVAPDALLDDGLFDIIVFGDLSKLEVLKSFPLIYKGAHMSHSKLRHYRGKHIKVTCQEAALIEIDGEQPGTSDAEFLLIPKGIQVLV